MRVEADEEQVADAVVGDRYRLVAKLGAGGMGTVWRARDEERGIDVALKFLNEPPRDRAAMVNRFAREAELSARMISRNVVRVLDRTLGPAGTPIIVYELLDGEDLETRLEREGRLPVAATGEIIVQVCRALERAHAVKVVHRDIKPGNIFLCEDDDRVLVKVLDFGIAKVRHATARDSLPPGSLTGTLDHMTPEHVLDGAPADVVADLYALGVVGYRCITGRVPFRAEALMQLVASFSQGPPPLVSSLVSGVPPAVDEFFAKAIHRTASERFASAGEMARAAIDSFRASASALRISRTDVLAQRDPLARE